MKNLDKNYKYIVACSFGPDSMALLDMLIKENYDVVVAHVNYHKRDVSNFEEESLKKYCLKKNVPIEVLDTTGLVCKKNFQDWAREIRYKFFKKVLEKYRAKAVVVAHQQDDLIETFFIQKQRGGIVKYSGIAEKTTIFDVDIIRPLLDFSKQELLDYDIKNNVPYSIDVSNLGDDYLRNQIRHNIVENLSKKEREEILEVIRKTNDKKTIDIKTKWLVDEFLDLDNESIVSSISTFLNERDLHKNISFRFIQEVKDAIKSKKSYVRIELADHVCLCKEYNQVLLIDEDEYVNFEYVINSNGYVDDDLFLIDFRNGGSDRNVNERDYPLVVKPLSKNDVYVIRDYECKVRRLFIDWKLPHHLRKIWPGVYNKEGKLIYIPRYREKFVDKHVSKFVIKFTK